MSKRGTWHEIHTSSWLGGTYTAWCGQKVRKQDVEKSWLHWGNACPACQHAKKRGRR